MWNKVLAIAKTIWLVLLYGTEGAYQKTLEEYRKLLAENRRLKAEQVELMEKLGEQ